MAFPTGWDLVNITGTYIGRNGVPSVGTVTFSSPQLVLRSGTIVPAADIVFTLDVNGKFTGQIPATDDPNAQPSGWTYTVTENVPGGRQGIQISAPYTSPGIDMSTVVPVYLPQPPTTQYPFVTLQQLASTSSTSLSGAALVGFLQSGTGSVGRTVEQKLLESVSVLDKGADSTGATDSLAAFNSAIAVNGYALIPPGTYDLSANTSVGTWFVMPEVTFTGAGALTGTQFVSNASSSGLPYRMISNNLTASQIIGKDIQIGFYQSGSIAADSFGQTVETWTPSASSAIFSGQLTGAYGSFSHFGSGALNAGYGASFEGFNSGSATAIVIVGVEGNAYNGGVSAGSPSQTPTNNGVATNLRGVSGRATNLSSGVVSNAACIFAEGITNTGGGTIANVYGIKVSSQTAGAQNYAFYSDGPGYHSLGDALEVRGATNLPAAKNNVYFTVAAGPGGPSAGRIYCGDGTGYRVEFASRTASTDTVVGYMRDNGLFVTTNGIQASGGEIGYTTGAGGAVTQTTSKSTNVTLNTSCGTITTTADALAAGAIAHFDMFNSKIVVGSIIVTSVQSGVINGAYAITIDNVQNGACGVTIHNISAGSLSEAIKINFAIIASVSA